MAQVVSLNFHQTFRPEKQYIAAILELAEDPTVRTVKEISSLTGIPNGESSRTSYNICDIYGLDYL